MPKRGYNPKYHRYQTHKVWRPDKLFTTHDGDPKLGGTSGNTRWGWHKRVSCWVRGKKVAGGFMKLMLMRQQTGRMGWSGTWKPLLVKEEVVEYSAAPQEDFLKLPEKKFFELNRPDVGRLSREEQVFRALPAENRVESREEWELQPVRHVTPSYSSHLTEVPRTHGARYHGGLAHPRPNTFSPVPQPPPEGLAEVPSHLDDLARALAGGGAAAQKGTFMTRKPLSAA
eukprot:TRINITY_DN20965_c0_g1_i1.p1 TRINITY_DN20965_c0_g1~~TRINITY_DN20965_c0_g1_i1.p1  ORF type:complete len:228 (+),score=66.98 TRINITY_DN20965_c0_g1_i1:80-763(+)